MTATYEAYKTDFFWDEGAVFGTLEEVEEYQAAYEEWLDSVDERRWF